jgi:phosphopantetheine adenylyltransferase
MKRFLPFFFLFLLVGCGNHNVYVSKPKPIPNWYLNPPKSTQQFVYVTGSGVDKKEAVLNALNNFISRYSVTISSNFETKSESFGGGLYNKNSVNNIKATVKKFEVSNYDLIKVQKQSFDKFFVLVRVDINKLYENVKNQLDNRFKEYQNEYHIISNENLLNQFIDLQKLLKKIQKEKNYISILKVMNNSFNEKSYLSFINKVQNRLDSLKNSIHIQIKSNNYIFAEDIKKYLTNKGIKIGRSDIRLEINVNKKNSSSYMNLVIYQIYMNVKYKNNTIGSNFFKVVTTPHSSVNGYLFNDIKKLSLEKFLNLK